MVAKGTDAQQMLKASIDDIIRLKAENTKLKDLSEVRNFEQRYCTLQQPSVESSARHNPMTQSFGFGGGAGTQPSEKCFKCAELKQVNAQCEVQMKEGRAKLEESAIIVQEVAKELKVKDENMEKVSDRLF